MAGSNLFTKHKKVTRGEKKVRLRYLNFQVGAETCSLPITLGSKWQPLRVGSPIPDRSFAQRRRWLEIRKRSYLRAGGMADECRRVC